MSEETESEMTKLFISHASEDKQNFVEPLRVKLREAGFDTWYDKDELTIGDSLLHGIGRGLNECDFGTVVLSKHFFEKKWPRAELEGLFSLETTERKVILPIWKDVSEEDVRAFSPILAARLGVPASKGVDEVVGEIQRAVQVARRASALNSLDIVTEKFLALDQEFARQKRARELEESHEGRWLVASSAERIVGELRRRVEDLGKKSQVIVLRIKKDTLDGPTTLSISASFSLRIFIHYGNSGSSSVGSRCLVFRVTQVPSETILRCLEFRPSFRDGESVVWSENYAGSYISSDDLAERLLNEILEAIRKADEAEKERKSR